MNKRLACALLSASLCIGIGCSAEPVTENQAKVAPKGVTVISAVFGKKRVSVKITSHEVDIGKPSDAWPEKRLSSCTYSRYPCSPIDYLEIFIDDKPLFVARSVYADLSDVSEAILRQEKGQFVLVLNGGDASESYTVKIVFDYELIRKRTLISNEAGQVMQETIYSAPKSMAD